MLTTTPTSTVVTDASVWVSRLVPSDVNHVAAGNWMVQHVGNGGGFIAPALLLPEVAGAIARVTGQPSLARAAVTQLTSFAYLELVEIGPVLVTQTVNSAISFTLRGSDAFYVALAMHYSIPLLTFDREQLTRPASAIATIQP